MGHERGVIFFNDLIKEAALRAMAPVTKRANTKRPRSRARARSSADAGEHASTTYWLLRRRVLERAPAGAFLQQPASPQDTSTTRWQTEALISVSWRGVTRRVTAFAKMGNSDVSVRR